MQHHAKTILIADDEDDLRLLVQITLEDPSLRVITVENGHRVLERVQEEQPDVIILDWMMPGLSGIEVLKRLRANPETAAIPVVFLTARDQPEDVEQARLLGVFAYLIKPFSPLELLDRVHNALRHRSQSLS